MPAPADPRKKPASVKIHVSTGAGVDIAWSDGHSSHYDFPYLRDHCPCATCNEERYKKGALAPPVGSPSAVLPIFKPTTSARAAKPIGNYAVQLTFSDGHSTGIYSFDYLRAVCPCEDCAREFRSSNE